MENHMEAWSCAGLAQETASNPRNGLWILLVLGLYLAYQCVRSWRLPETDDLIELGAFAGGIWGALQLLVHALVSHESFDVAVATGGAVAVLLLTLRGTWNVLRKYRIGDAESSYRPLTIDIKQVDGDRWIAEIPGVAKSESCASPDEARDAVVKMAFATRTTLKPK